MLKPIKWSSFAEEDLADLLEYLVLKWNNSVCVNYLNELDYCILHIQKNPNQFPTINKKLKIRKCVVTKHNSLFYKVTKERIEILRLYDNRQNPETLKL